MKVKIYCNCGHSFEAFVLESMTIPVVTCPKCGHQFIGWDEVEPTLAHLYCDDEPTCDSS